MLGSMFRLPLKKLPAYVSSIADLMGLRRRSEWRGELGRRGT